MASKVNVEQFATVIASLLATANAQKVESFRFDILKVDISKYNIRRNVHTLLDTIGDILTWTDFCEVNGMWVVAEFEGYVLQFSKAAPHKMIFSDIMQHKIKVDTSAIEARLYEDDGDFDEGDDTDTE